MKTIKKCIFIVLLLQLYAKRPAMSLGSIGYYNCVCVCLEVCVKGTVCVCVFVCTYMLQLRSLCVFTIDNSCTVLVNAINYHH